MNSQAHQAGSPRSKDAFPTTRWSVVMSAGCTSSPGAKRALASLCETYWHPLYAYVRRRVSDVNEAHDLTQSFFAEFLEKAYASAATPERGRFRAFLLTAFKHFLSKEWDKAKAQKRGGGLAPFSLDFASADSNLRIEPSSSLTAEQLYDRNWAVTLLDLILTRLRGEFASAGNLRRFDELKGLLIGDHAATTYAEVAEKLNITEAAAKMAVSRMRRRYRELLLDEIAQTVAGPDDVEDELHNLFAALEL